ncbi:hypothetical protein IM511_08055 [Erythrobacteraceae bacterium E2-1 Yellow Sea]|nr:hypothetical protein [Erythrobacteraceae bacterium E2-1 Yellow Sea]
MSSAPNFYYQANPTADIAGGLAAAIFGNPAARAKQQQQMLDDELTRANIERANASAAYDTARTDGVTIQNNAANSLPELLAGFRAQPAQEAIPAPENDLAAGTPYATSAVPARPAVTQEEAFQQGLPAMVAMMAQMQGDKVDPRHVVGTLASFIGGDEMARRGLIAQGHTPGEEFAITPERADDIARAKADAAARQAFGVAEINNRDDIAVARINHANDIPVANIKADADRDVAGIKVEADASKAKVARRGRITPDNWKMLRDEVSRQLVGYGFGIEGIDDGKTKDDAKPERNIPGVTGALIRAEAEKLYQQGMNPTAAVSTAISNVMAKGRKYRERSKVDGAEPSLWDDIQLWLQGAGNSVAN